MVMMVMMVMVRRLGWRLGLGLLVRWGKLLLLLLLLLQIRSPCRSRSRSGGHLCVMRSSISLCLLAGLRESSLHNILGMRL